MPHRPRLPNGSFMPKHVPLVKVISDMETVLVLKTVDKDMKAHGGFTYPTSGIVVAPDWEPTEEYGNGLHGFLWGAGDSKLLSWNDDAKWLVLKVLKKDIIDLVGKVKFPKGEVIHVGDRKSATDFICAHPESFNKRVIGCYRKVGDYGVAVGGDYSDLTGDDDSTLIGRDHCILTGGDYSTLTGRDHCIVTGGHASIITGGSGSTLNGEDYSTITGGDCSTITGGEESILTGGFGSTITGGECSTITGGEDSFLTGGKLSTLTWKIWNNEDRFIHHTVYVGENGIKPNTKYTWKNGKATKVP